MTIPALDIDTAVACLDPDCITDVGARSVAEPEHDGDYRYYCCTTCGHTFGFVQSTSYAIAAQNGGFCAVGVPEDVRRAASAPMEHSIAAAQPGPLLTIGRRPDAY